MEWKANKDAAKAKEIEERRAKAAGPKAETSDGLGNTGSEAGNSSSRPGTPSKMSQNGVHDVVMASGDREADRKSVV